MRALIGTTVFALTLTLASATTRAQTASSTFDADLEGWRTLNGVDFTNEITWSPIDGNPDGFARFDDALDGTTYYIAPAAFLGDWSALDGLGVIAYDQIVLELGTTPVIHAYEVIISGPGGIAQYVETAIAPNILKWTTINAPLTENRWSLKEGSWAALLDDVTGLAIRAELVSSTRDASGLDNVFLGIPEPATLCLLAAGALVVLRRRR